MQSKISHAWTLTNFFIRRQLHGFSVSDTPHMDPEGLSFFANCLKKCRSYLEYGSGGSTVMAARLGVPFISVDNDRVFHSAVHRAIGPLKDDQILLTVDTGLTGPWGYPVFKKKTSRSARAWASYPHAPWNHIARGAAVPDLILIDGRFRAASALVSLNNLPHSEDVVILVDDYVGREHYRAIENFATLERTAGSIAVFRPRQSDRGALMSAIAEYETDYR